MKWYYANKRTFFCLVLLGLCTVSLVALSGNRRANGDVPAGKPSLCSFSAYDKGPGASGSISCTASIPLRALWETKVAGAEAAVTDCGCHAGASEEYLYWHTELGNGCCRFERERILVCKGCGEVRQRYPSEFLEHAKGDGTLPGLCIE